MIPCFLILVLKLKKDSFATSYFKIIVVGDDKNVGAMELCMKLFYNTEGEQSKLLKLNFMK